MGDRALKEEETVVWYPFGVTYLFNGLPYLTETIHAETEEEARAIAKSRDKTEERYQFYLKLRKED